jgi:hypothetical protein
MSVEEEARKANLNFWQLGNDLSGSDEEAKEATTDEVGEEAKEGAADEVDSESEYEFEAEDGNDTGSSNGDEEDDTSSHGGGDRMDVGGSDAAAKKKKKKKKKERQDWTGTQHQARRVHVYETEWPTRGACEACRWVWPTARAHHAGEHEHQPEEHKS